MSRKVGQPSRRYWTDEEVGFLEDHQGEPTAWIAAELDRTVIAVSVKRRKLQQGIGPAIVDVGWTDDELDILRATPHLTAQQVASQIPGRTRSAVRNCRHYLARAEGIRFFAQHGDRKNPHEVGGRPLIAKTCLRCGRLLDASRFGFIATVRRWNVACASCANRADRREKHGNAPNHAAACRRSLDRLQALTRERATRHGYPWVAADDKVLRDPDLSVVEKALSLGRTYMSAQQACHLRGYSSRKGRGDETKGEWIIDNPNQPEVAA